MRKNNTKIFIGLLFFHFFYDVYHLVLHSLFFKQKTVISGFLNRLFKALKEI